MKINLTFLEKGSNRKVDNRKNTRFDDANRANKEQQVDFEEKILHDCLVVLLTGRIC
jgi:hypothetical protein